jgi:hypothetical protein
MTDGSRFDDPRYDVAARDFHLARELPVRIHGKTLVDLIAEVEEALADLIALPDDEAFGGDLIGVTTALLGVQEFLRDLEKKFDAAGTSKREAAS